MPNIRPSSEIRNNYSEMARMCKETGMPIYLTVNGKGDTALINVDVLDELYTRLELYSKLSIAQKDIEEGRVKTNEEVYSKLKNKAKNE